MLVTPQGGMPTLAAAAGAPQPESVAIDGVDLLPLVTVDGAPAAHQASSRGRLYPSIVQMPVMIGKTLTQKFVEGDEYIYTPN